MTTNITLPRDVVEDLLKACAWVNFGDCRAINERPIVDLSDAYERARAALAQQPAQVPLTDEQMLAALCRIDARTVRLTPGFRAFAKAIEAAHGIGNA